MDHKNKAQQQGPAAMPRPATGQKGVRPTEPVRFPASPGVCIAGSTAKGLYRIVQAYDMESRMGFLQSRAPHPLEIAAWLPGSYAESKRQRSRLCHLFLQRGAGDGWYGLSASGLAEARAYLNGEKDRLEKEADRARQEAARAQEKAAKTREDALDGCLQLIGRLRALAEVVRWNLDQERRTARAAWPHQQGTDACLQLVDWFHAVTGKFDAAISRSAMEIQLARMPKDDAALPEL
ncbi:hypothetical protein SBA2_980009 [Acidobacteriia bacterium SbA2]|nr:hypothetical protein SBA2_980009 [Acidobacteriia bacterium SbA2]